MIAHAHAAFTQAWPAFALVAGLLLVGAAAADEGLFAAAGAFVARAPGGAFALLPGLLALEAVVTAVLNLDMLNAARARDPGGRLPLRPSLRRHTRLGVVLVPLTLAASLLVTGHA